MIEIKYNGRAIRESLKIVFVIGMNGLLFWGCYGLITQGGVSVYVGGSAIAFIVIMWALLWMIVKGKLRFTNTDRRCINSKPKKAIQKMYQKSVFGGLKWN